MKKFFPHLVLLLCLITLTTVSIVQTINVSNLKTELDQRKNELTNIAAGSNLNAEQVQKLTQKIAELNGENSTKHSISNSNCAHSCSSILLTPFLLFLNM